MNIRMTIRESSGRLARSSLLALSLLSCLAVEQHAAYAQDPFIDAVDSFTLGTSGGFGSALLPAIVLGPPLGGGLVQGSFDVVSLGSGGSIVVQFDLPVICDGPGIDFTVFENAFHSGSPSGPLFAEYGFVAVSQDGVDFVEFPWDATTKEGLAGQTPVLSHPSNGIDPLDPAVSGGDGFDLATVGLAWAAYVRITDVAGVVPDLGDLPQFTVPPNAGFELDAIAAPHACDPGLETTPTSTATFEGQDTPTATPTPTPTPALEATATFKGDPSPAHDAEAIGRGPKRVRIQAGQSSVTKRFRIRVRNGDESGEIPLQLSGDGCANTSLAIDLDRRTTGDQDTAVVGARRKRAAVVSFTVFADDFTTPDRRLPSSCLLTFTASVDVAGNTDPRPENDSAEVELQVVDLNDAE